MPMGVMVGPMTKLKIRKTYSQADRRRFEGWKRPSKPKILFGVKESALARLTDIREIVSA